MMSMRKAMTAVMATICLTGLAGTPAGGAPAAGTSFKGSSSRLDGLTRREMTGKSWHRGCPVPLGDLRLLKVRHWGFDGEVHSGRMVVNEDSDRRILRVMRQLFEMHFAIRRMHLVDAYGADDHRSMKADNTSAFNCRFVSGRPGVWSEHAYGRAIDLNPVENPYMSGSYVSPPAGKPFAKRHPRRKGMVTRHGQVVEAFAGAGWGWGGNWSGDRDFQHFSASGH